MYQEWSWPDGVEGVRGAIFHDTVEKYQTHIWNTYIHYSIDYFEMQ